MAKTPATTEPKRIGLFGASGTGKTTKARTIIRNIKRLVVFDAKREFVREGKGWLPLSSPVYSLDELKSVLKRRWTKDFQVVYCPTFGNEAWELHAVSTLVYAFQSGYKRDHMAKITLFVDEAQLGVPAGIVAKNPVHGTILVARMGRDRGINLILASQRMKAVDINIRANLSDYYVFRLSDLSDITEAAKIVMDKQKLQKMANFQYFYKNEQGNIQFFS